MGHGFQITAGLSNLAVMLLLTQSILLCLVTVSGDNCSYEMCQIQSNHHHQQTNTQPLPVTQPTVSQHWRHQIAEHTKKIKIKNYNHFSRTKHHFISMTVSHNCAAVSVRAWNWTIHQKQYTAPQMYMPDFQQASKLFLLTMDCTNFYVSTQ